MVAVPGAGKTVPVGSARAVFDEVGDEPALTAKAVPEGRTRVFGFAGALEEVPAVLGAGVV